MKLLTVEEAAQTLRLSTAWVRQRILRREIEFLKIGRRVFIAEKTIDNILTHSVVEMRLTNKKIGRN